MRCIFIVIGIFSVLFTTPVFSYVDSLWIIGGVGSPGDLVSIEVWLQYEGGGITDSLEAFDIPLTWDASICSVETITVGPDFSAWAFYGRIDNGGIQGPPSLPKIGISAYTFGPPIGPPFAARGTHLAATADFRIFDTATPGDSVYVDTLMQAFSPPIYLGFMDKIGLFTYTPTYAGDHIAVFYCGDCNGDGCVSFLDVSYLNDYIFLAGPPPLGSGNVNQDGFIDVNDVIYLTSYLFDGGPPPCGVLPPLCMSTSSLNDSVEIGETEICCSTTTISLPITLKNSSTLMGMTFALKYDTSLVVCDSAIFNSGIFGSWSQESRIDSDSGTILLAVWTPSLSSPYHLSPGTYETATLWFSSVVPPHAQESVSIIDTIFILPDHKVSVVDDNETLLRPAVATGMFYVSPHCGDANADCRITVADALYLTTYTYRHGPAPICWADVNLDGNVTVADAIYLVTYIYRGGAPLCDPPVGLSPTTNQKPMGR